MQQGELDSPLVFQCKQCRLIVGDTFGWITANQKLNIIALSAAAPSITVSEETITSSDRHDRGFTYSPMACECGAPLGRVYRTTSVLFDLIRDAFSFDVPALASYKLGSGVPIQDPFDWPLPSIKVMDEQIYKIKQLIFVMDERITQLESRGPGP
eukprot:m.32721 g.32721  ORF g.32721 m.32721 type:complete len:155 (+) comp42542_c0_seq1:56-520(+)